MKVKRNKFGVFLIVMSLCLMFTSCNSDTRESTAIEKVIIDTQPTKTVTVTEETKMKGETMRIQANTQLTYKDLKIGTGNFWEEEYTADNNETIKGLTAGLWIYVKDQPKEDKSFRVFPGMKIEVAGYQILVKSVFQENGKQFVELVIGK